MHIPKTQSRVGQRFAGVTGLGELSRSLFDDALVICDDEREATFLASARLLLHLEDEERRRECSSDERFSRSP